MSRKRCGECWWFKRDPKAHGWQVPSGNCINLDKIRDAGRDKNTVGLPRYVSNFSCVFCVPSAEVQGVFTIK